MLVEIAILDAFGHGYEFRRDHPPLSLDGYLKHPTHGLEAGMYTDDTQRMIGNVLAMLDRDISHQNLAKRYVDVFKRDPRNGYAGRYQNFLESVKDGEDYLARIKPDSEKSGACMSASVFGLYPTLDECIKHASVQASITHNTAAGINAATAVAASAWYMRNKHGKQVDLGEWLETQIDNKSNGNWSANWTASLVSVKAMDCTEPQFGLFGPAIQ